MSLKTINVGRIAALLAAGYWALHTGSDIYIATFLILAGM